MSDASVQTPYFLANAFARRFILGLLDADAALAHTVFDAVHQPQYRHSSALPPDNLNLEFPIEQFVALHQACNALGDTVARRAAWQMCARYLDIFPQLAELKTEKFALMTFKEQTKLALLRTYQFIFHFPIQRLDMRMDGALHIDENDIWYNTSVCPCCYGLSLKAHTPACYVVVGLLEGTLRWAMQWDFKISQYASRAQGKTYCGFVLVKPRPQYAID